MEEGIDGIKLSGWGATLEAHGHWVSSSILAIILCVGFIILHDGQVVSVMSQANYFLEIRHNQDDLIEIVKKLQSENETQTWLMSMPFEERPVMITPEARALIDKENEATKKLLDSRRKRRK